MNKMYRLLPTTYIKKKLTSDKLFDIYLTIVIEIISCNDT